MPSTATDELYALVGTSSAGVSLQRERTQFKMKAPITVLENSLSQRMQAISDVWPNRCDRNKDALLSAIRRAKQVRDAIRILNAVEREAVGEQVNPEEVFEYVAQLEELEHHSKNDLKVGFRRWKENRG